MKSKKYLNTSWWVSSFVVVITLLGIGLSFIAFQIERLTKFAINKLIKVTAHIKVTTHVSRILDDGRRP